MPSVRGSSLRPLCCLSHRLRGSFRGLLAVALLSHTTWALFEDEVGQYDWLLQQLGQPTDILVTPQDPASLLVGSESGVVASVWRQDGTLKWRRIVEPAGSVRLLRTSAAHVVSVTEQNSVQAWRITSGSLIWQLQTQDRVVDLFASSSGKDTRFLLLTEKLLEARAPVGKLQWSRMSESEARFVAAAVVGDSLCCVEMGEELAEAARILHFEVATGQVRKKVPLPGVEKSLEQGNFLVVDEFLVALEGSLLVAYDLDSGGKLPGVDLSATRALAPFRLSPWRRTPRAFAVASPSHTLIVGIGQDGALRLLQTFEGSVALGPIFFDNRRVAVARLGPEEMRLDLLDVATGELELDMTATDFNASFHGSADLLVALPSRRKGGAHDAVIRSATCSLAALSDSKVLWLREEALAHIRQAVFYSRSAAASQALHEAHASDDAAASALVAQLSTLPAQLVELVGRDPAETVKAFARWVTPKRSRRKKPSQLLPGARVPSSSGELSDFGGDKLLIAGTWPGKLFALEVTTSEIVWSRHFGPLRDGCSRVCGPPGDTRIGRCAPYIQLVPSASAAYSELVVVDPSASVPRVLWLEPLTGEILHEEPLPSSIGMAVSIISFPKVHGDHEALGPGKKVVQPLLIVDEDHKVHRFPGSAPWPAEVEKVSRDHNRLFHFEVDTTKEAVRGFVLGHNSVRGQPSKGQGQSLVPLWNLELGLAGEHIIASALPQHREWGHVPVHIKGDASILYKYMNRNMIAVVTEDTDSSMEAINLYALDVVTGHVLHQSHIDGGSEPVQLALCDNWIVMHYANRARARFEVVVVDFYQAKADDGPWDVVFGRSAHNRTLSAHHLETPVSLQQTFVLPVGVSTMAVTATLKGITPRSIIMALTTEKIFRVSKDMLNPRRPYVNRAGEKEKNSSLPKQFAPSKIETVAPYSPVIPLMPTDVLSYYHALPRVTGIVSSPSALESTSLVFCYGLDLFFVPVQTAKAYDVLSPGFNYVLLYLSVGGVVVIWVVTAFWARQKSIKDRWK